jgi:hypothetical protein
MSDRQKKPTPGTPRAALIIVVLAAVVVAAVVAVVHFTTAPPQPSAAPPGPAPLDAGGKTRGRSGAPVVVEVFSDFL